MQMKFVVEPDAQALIEVAARLGPAMRAHALQGRKSTGIAFARPTAGMRPRPPPTSPLGAPTGSSLIPAPQGNSWLWDWEFDGGAHST